MQITNERLKPEGTSPICGIDQTMVPKRGSGTVYQSDTPIFNYAAIPTAAVGHIKTLASDWQLLA